MDDLERKIAKAKASIVMAHPFEAVIVLKTKWVRDENLFPPTMATDGRHIYWHPDFVEKTPHSQLVGVIVHEADHIAGLHMFRREEREPWEWNIACDKVVNDMVLSRGLELPDDTVPPVAESSPEKEYSKQQQEGGSGIPRPEWGLVLDPKNADGSSVPKNSAKWKELEESTKMTVRGAATAAKQAGALPAGMERWIEDTLETIVPWKEILWRFVDGFTRDDYSWQRPNRRHLNGDFILPSRHTPDIAEIVFAGDTSGSIDHKTLQRIVSELLACLDMYQGRGRITELLALWCDTEVTAQHVTNSGDIKPVGGGGTAYSPVWQWLDEHDYEPRAVVYVTDGYCHDFGEAPGYEVLWMLTQKNDAFDPPFGEVAYVIN